MHEASSELLRQIEIGKCMHQARSDLVLEIQSRQECTRQAPALLSKLKLKNKAQGKLELGHIILFRKTLEEATWNAGGNLEFNCMILIRNYLQP